VEQSDLTARIKIIPEAAPGVAKHEAYLDADILLLPSPYNEFPLVLLEAMAHGLPIVTAEQSIAEHIHERCGLVTQPTAEAFAAALTSLFTKQEQLTQYQAAGPKIFREHFTLEKYTQKLAQVYQQYLS
jgi:glycosyltransferase involved in cell wall biosynthesis